MLLLYSRFLTVIVRNKSSVLRAVQDDDHATEAVIFISVLPLRQRSSEFARLQLNLPSNNAPTQLQAQLHIHLLRGVETNNSV